MTRFIYILLLAHLLGDFVFQSNKIAAMKAKSIKGITIHVMISGAINVIMMGVFYGLRGMFIAVCVTIIHFVIDYLKYKITKKIANIQTLYFLFDQGLHISVLLIASSLWLNPIANYNIDVRLLLIGILMIISCYVLTILVKDVFLDFGWIMNSPFFERNERRIDGITAWILLVGFILNFWIGMTSLLFGTVGYYIVQKRLYSYSLRMIGMKYIVFSLFSIIGLII